MTTDVIVFTDGTTINGHTITYRPEDGWGRVLNFATDAPINIPLSMIRHYYTPKKETRPGRSANYRILYGKTIGTQPYHDVHPDEIDLEEGP